MTIGVLERNRAVLHRATRVVRAASNLAWVAAEQQPAVLRDKLAPVQSLNSDAHLSSLDAALTLSAQAR
jgi:hypothetical protein